MVAHAQAELPNECCGFLAGKVGTDGIARIERRYPLVNALASPVAYLWEPKGLFAAVRDMRPSTWKCWPFTIRIRPASQCQAEPIASAMPRSSRSSGT